MIVYSYYGDDSSQLFPSLAAAKKAAREELRNHEYLTEIEIERHEVVTITKQSLIDIINTNGGSWSAASRTVETIKRRK